MISVISLFLPSSPPQDPSVISLSLPPSPKNPSNTTHLQGSREQLAIAAFAQSLLIIPTTLAVNAAKDSSELVAQLRSRHALSQRVAAAEAKPDPHAPASSQPMTPDEQKQLAKSRQYRNYGLDLVKGKVHDCIKAGVLEPSMSKVKSLKSAVEAVIAIMRIDTLIKLDPEQRGDGGDDGHGH